LFRCSQPAQEAKSDETKSDDAKPSEAKPEAKKGESSKETAKAPPKKQVRVLPLSGSYEDSPSSVGFNPTNLVLGGGGAKPKGFYKLCDYLDELSHEELVTHVVFDLSSSALSMNSAATRRVVATFAASSEPWQEMHRLVGVRWQCALGNRRCMR
jgi:hypothetical protein